MDLSMFQGTLIVLAAACLFSRWTSIYASPLYLSAYAFITLILAFMSQHGWDHEVYCLSLRLLSLGLNPYSTEAFLKVTEVPTNLAFSYPPLAAFFLAPFCSLPNLLFPLLYGTLLILIGFLFRGSSLEDNLYMIAIIVSGFAGFQWCFFSGNIGVIELSLLLLSVRLFSKKRYYLSGAALGFLGFFKILFLFYVPLFFFVKAGRDRAVVRPFLLGLSAVFSVLHLVSFLAFPGLFIPFLEKTWSFLPWLGGNLAETGAGWHNPTLPLVIHAWGSRYLPGYGTGVILVALFLAFLFRLQRDYSLWKKDDPLKVLSFGILVFSLALPRLKPYSLIIATIPLFLVTNYFKWKNRSGILLLSCVLPQLLFMGIIRSPESFLSIFIETYQATCLLFSVIFVYFLERKVQEQKIPPSPN